MAISFHEFYEYGNIAAEAADSEFSWRNGASRIYYAAYHSANQLVQHCPDNSHKSMGSHERLSDRFKLHSSKGALSIAYVLENMKKVRHMADYDLDSPFLQAYARTQAASFRRLEDQLLSFSKNMEAKNKA